ncbi:Protein RETICULATA-RELATED 4, chloroplastic [Turnera subulata]|uniref:Protein RETICULATA-RELATED 4, chloroplastic n=1 Tax=Turnera subulata TaxID=218843 RepID=A0A9Q0GB58_9ROSI|nr:Protein RETICULATA-RELATED 4, chloroplastic [Turnera subulata]
MFKVVAPSLSILLVPLPPPPNQTNSTPTVSLSLSPLLAMAIAATFSAVSSPRASFLPPPNSHRPPRHNFTFVAFTNHTVKISLPFLTRTTITPRNRFDHTPPIPSSFSSDGGGTGSTGGGGGEGRGGGDGDGDGEGEDDDAGSRNKAEALLALAVAKRSLESLPKDLALAIEAGRVPGSIVSRFFELEKSPLFRWLLQFGGFKERLLADDLFLVKVGIECGVGIFTKVCVPCLPLSHPLLPICSPCTFPPCCSPGHLHYVCWSYWGSDEKKHLSEMQTCMTAAELEKRRENFSKELDFVFADVVMAIIADFMLVWLPAPTVSLRPPLGVSSGRVANFFYSCPDNAFQIALAGTSYSLLQRIGAIVRNGAKLFAVGTSASLVGVGITNLLINARKAFDKSFAGEAEDVPIVSTSIGYGVYMAVSSNLRYQVLAGIIEQRILEPMLHERKLILSAICFAFRTGNTFLGSLMWVDYARWVGIQKIRE